MEELAARLEHVFARAERELAVVPATPEEHHSEAAYKLKSWMRFKNQVIGIFHDAYEAIPPTAARGASTRTALLEEAIKEMTEKLIQYPSSPYTLDSTQSLGNTISALKTSMEIDEMNLEAQEKRPAL